MEYNFENGPERFFTKEEVLEVIGKMQEGAKVTEEVLDKDGILFRLTARVESETGGEYREYEFMRKGRVEGGGGGSLVTSIEYVEYVDDMPVGGGCLANFDEVTGEWVYAKD
jgi:hypothetical protein